MQVVRYEEQHALQIIKANLRDAREVPDSVKEWIQASYKDGPAYTLVDDDIPIACGGVRKIWEGYGEAWMLVTEGAAKHAKTLLRESSRALNEIIDSCGLSRVEANVRTDRGDFCNWATHLGFSCIAKRRKYGPDGADYFLYERVK